MSMNRLDGKSIFSNRLKWGRFVCSFILFACLFSQAGMVNAQNQTVDTSVNENAINVLTSDVDGDGYNDASFENKNVKVVISSKTGAPSLYYLKGENFNENLFPPQIMDMGYSVEKSIMKGFEFDNCDGYFSKNSYNVEVESQSQEEVVIRATANVSPVVDETTPDNESVSLIKRYKFFKDGYTFKLEATVTNQKEKLIALGNASSSFDLYFGPGIFMDPFGPRSMIGLKSGGECEFFTNQEKVNETDRETFWGIGIKDQYFCAMIEADQMLKIGAVASTALSIDERKRPQPTHLISCSLPKFNLGAKESRTFRFNIYAGPIVYEELQKINRTKIGDFGFLNTLMLKTLRFFYSLIPNYGIAIILLTLLVRLVLYPLTLKQTKAMAQMQKLQPKIKDIQDRYKDDRQKMNEEVMKLYMKNNVSPLGGCLPLLLQLPIIMALYNTFRIAVELRKAPFLWMSDLSKGDPYLILPIAIMVLTYYQQGKANVDPQQRQAMAFMPMMMFVITWSLPSGLLVYWFASSVLGILQQLQANHYMASMKEE